MRGRASSTDPATWSTFDAALVAASAADGIGYVFTADDPYVGIDLDAGLSESDRGAIVGRLDSYAEFSVSGTGIHVIVRASLNGHRRNRSGPFEVYDQGRYFVMTGQHVRGTPTVEDRQVELDQVLAAFLPAEPMLPAAPAPVEPVDLDDRELLDRAMSARNGADFQRLWNGDIAGYGSHSEADLAFCCMLAFWTGRDAGRIDRLFRDSGLWREKWDRDDYRTRTIGTAISSTTDVYRPRPATSSPPRPQVTSSLVPSPSGGSNTSSLTSSQSPTRGLSSTSWRVPHDRPNRPTSSTCSIPATSTCSPARARR
jgi:primase-polymerase (primpol)-like protein